ncbi:hypothetical protein TNIN_260361 [Trichonephila inaurata madagascariensis]|uniref:Uncharacterized protein n=1 Tax=Trichonephila inaurata madagascariensis TaxID=2747483 RepID=A0A8X6X0R4_9ARAC|nr:hypothetical protein TNIN_260361 [Trichonephila inaurata madagascariensis]
MPNNSNFEIGSYNKDFHFIPNATTDTSSDNTTGENDLIDKVGCEEDEKELIDIFHPNLAFLSNNSNLEMGFYNEAFEFTPTPTIASPDKHIDKNVNENAAKSD